MPEKLDFTKPKYSQNVLGFREQIAQRETRYNSSNGWDRYLDGVLAARYRKYLIDLEHDIHRLVLFGRGYAICVCGLYVPRTSSKDEFPDFLETAGHLNSNQEPTKVFYFFKYLAPQYRVLHLVCQTCEVIEEVTPRETLAPKGPATHNCEERNSTIDFQS